MRESEPQLGNPSSTRGLGQLLLLLLGALSGLVGFAHPAPPRQGLPSGWQFAVTLVPANQSKEHAPLRVESVRLGHDGPVGKIEVYNASHKTILGYTLGWNIIDFVPDSVPKLRSGKKSLGGFSGPSVTTDLKPKKSEKTSHEQASAKCFERDFKNGMPKGAWVVVVGVTEVVFEDATHWSADPASFHMKDRD